MAVLKSPHWNTISPEMRDLLARLGQWSPLQAFYLAGGTALALQLGHRLSVDLDFFSATDEVRPELQLALLEHLLAVFPTTRIEQAWGNCVLESNGVRVGLFSYGYPLLEPPLQLESIALATPVDIGLMNLDALISRASRKDFYDLYFIAHSQPLAHLLEAGSHKYPYARDFEIEAVRSLTFFDNAERDLDPPLLQPVSWETVKVFFRAQAKSLAQQWL